MGDSETDHRNAVSPTEDDVLFGKGRLCDEHHGNQYFQELVAKHRPQYRMAKRKRKTALMYLIVAEIDRKGGRFLKRDRPGSTDKGGSSWYVADLRSVREKVSHALRDEKLYPAIWKSNGDEDNPSVSKPDIAKVEDIKGNGTILNQSVARNVLVTGPETTAVDGKGESSSNAVQIGQQHDGDSESEKTRESTQTARKRDRCDDSSPVHERGLSHHLRESKRSRHGKLSTLTFAIHEPSVSNQTLCGQHSKIDDFSPTGEERDHALQHETDMITSRSDTGANTLGCRRDSDQGLSHEDAMEISSFTMNLPIAHPCDWMLAQDHAAGLPALPSASSWLIVGPATLVPCCHTEQRYSKRRSSTPRYDPLLHQRSFMDEWDDVGFLPQTEEESRDYVSRIYDPYPDGVRGEESFDADSLSSTISESETLHERPMPAPSPVRSHQYMHFAQL